MKSKFFRLKFLLIISLSVSLFSVYPFIRPLVSTAQAATASQCDPAAGKVFACLGEAINARIIGDPNRTSENLGRNTADLSMSILYSIDTLLGGAGPLNQGQTGAGANHFSFPPNPYIEGGGAIGTLAQATTYLYVNSPGKMADAGRFFRETLANNILNPDKAYAQVQGVGTSSLINSGFFKLWQLFRNIAYLAVAVALAFFGLMVMFRAKSDPRTTITYQMALPRVAIALVVIYFSLPLAGLTFDIGEVGISIVRTFFCVTGSCPIQAPAGTDPSIWPMNANIGTMMEQFVNPFRGLGIEIDLGDNILNGFAGVLVRVWAFMIVLRLFMTLLTRYLTFIMQAIFAPIIFALGVIPGRDESIGRWFKQILVSTLTFPGMFLLINIANFIRIQTAANIALPSMAGQVNTVNVSGLLAIGILSMAPKIPALLEEMFDVVPGAHSSHAGVEPGAALKGLPVLGKLT